MRLALLTLAFVGAAVASTVSRQAAVNKAIEQTKSRQTNSHLSPPQRVPQRQNVRLSMHGGDAGTTSSPGKTEPLDVEKLNRLIRALDKTWIMPRSGAKEPVGSNFQYKKTCSSIYKARHGACQQLGFGVMCFNYCHERGEKLAFRCQDASDAAYCRQSGTFETFLAKYRKDGYKAKAYIHQMISRCYSTSVCNTQTGLLNSTIIDEEVEIVEKTTKANRMRLLTRPPNGLKMLKPKPTTQEPVEEDVKEEDEEQFEELTTTTTKRAKSTEKKRVTLRSRTTGPPTVETTTKSNIWDKFTVGQKAKPTPKYIPFWQRLLSTTTAAPREDEEFDKEKDKESSTEITEEPMTTPATTTRVVDVKEVEEETAETVTSTSSTIPPEDVIVTQRPVQKANREKPKSTAAPTLPPKHTFRPLPVTLPPQGPELAFQKPNPLDGISGPGFWNRFQPNRWFQSIHYVTNTGK